MIVGLTGGVASGKNLVAEEFKALGAAIIDADIIAREVIELNTLAYTETVRTFGTKILRTDKSIDRKKLGQIVFSDPEKLKELNAITHPVIMKEVEARVEGLKESLGDDALIILNAPLLIEVGHLSLVDKLIVVHCNEDTQIERIVKRDSLTKVQALERINSQMPLTEKIKLSDISIENNGTKEETLKQVQKIYASLRGT